MFKKKSHLKVIKMRKDIPKTFMEQITTIHGTNYFYLKSGRSRWLWGFAMIMNLIFTIIFILMVEQKFQNNLIFTKIDATCQVNQVPFPAVSICNFNMVSSRGTSNIAGILQKHNRTEKEINKFFEDLPKLKDYRTADTDGAVEIMSILKRHYYTMDTIMEEIYQKCENLLVYCTFNRKVKNCVEIFNLVKTAEGHCCAFNYAALNDLAENPLTAQDETLEYYDGEDEGDEVTGSIIATSESGRASGLTVVFDVEPDDYPSWSTVPNYGATVLISDPNDFPETSVRNRFVTKGTSVDIKVKPMVFQAEADLRGVPLERRSCWFHDEVALEHTDRYSYETCMTECNMKSSLQFCGCTPYKYPREESRRFCELMDLSCLNNLTVHGKEVPCDPVCYVECRDKGYTIASNVVPFLMEDFPHDVMSGRETNHLSSVKVYFGKSTCNCYKLTLIMDVTSFIATYGGVMSLSFGASLLTVVELVYLFISYLLLKLTTYLNKVK